MESTSQTGQSAICYLELPIEVRAAIHDYLTDRITLAALRACCHQLRCEVLPLPDVQVYVDNSKRYDYAFGLPPSPSELGLVERVCTRQKVSQLGLYAATWPEASLDALVQIYRNSKVIQRVYFTAEKLSDAQLAASDAAVFLRAVKGAWPGHKSLDRLQQMSAKKLLDYRDKFSKERLRKLKQAEVNLSICSWYSPSSEKVTEGLSGNQCFTDSEFTSLTKVMQEETFSIMSDMLRRSVFSSASDLDGSNMSAVQTRLMAPSFRQKVDLGKLNASLPTYEQLAEDPSRRGSLQLLQLFRARMLLWCAGHQTAVKTDASMQLLDSMINALRRGNRPPGFVWTQGAQLPTPIVRKISGHSLRLDLVFEGETPSVLAALRDELQESPRPVAELGLWNTCGRCAVEDLKQLYLGLPKLRVIVTNLVERTAFDDKILHAKAVLLCLEKHKPKSPLLAKLKQSSAEEISRYRSKMLKSDQWGPLFREEYGTLKIWCVPGLYIGDGSDNIREGVENAMQIIVNRDIDKNYLYWADFGAWQTVSRGVEAAKVVERLPRFEDLAQRADRENLMQMVNLYLVNELLENRVSALWRSEEVNELFKVLQARS